MRCPLVKPARRLSVSRLLMRQHHCGLIWAGTLRQQQKWSPLRPCPINKRERRTHADFAIWAATRACCSSWAGFAGSSDGSAQDSRRRGNHGKTGIWSAGFDAIKVGSALGGVDEFRMTAPAHSPASAGQPAERSMALDVLGRFRANQKVQTVKLPSRPSARPEIVMISR